MPTTQLQLRRGNTAQTAIFTGAVGEVTVDTDKKTLIVHDGVTPGGIEISLKSITDFAYSQANTATNNAATADQRAVTSGSYANSAFGVANTANQRAVTSGSYANSAYAQANTATTLSQSAYDQANTATNNAATADQKAVSAGVYANSAYAQANTSDQKAVTSGDYANSAYLQANTATTNAATADQKAVTSGVYANSAYGQANTGTVLAQAAYDSANNVGPQVQPAFNAANSAGSYANSAYATANSLFDGTSVATVFAFQLNSADITSNGAMVISTGASGGTPKDLTLSPSSGITKTSGTILIQDNDILALAQSAYGQGNTADQKAVTSGDYANSAYAHANTKFSASGGTISGNVTVGTFVNFTTGLSDPSYEEGRVYYDSGSKSLAYYNDDSQSYIHVGQDVVTRVWNNSGVTLPRANCVFISGTSSANGFPSVKLASADAAANSEVIGLTTASIAPGGYGFVLMSGRIQGLNTSSITEGSELFLSATEPGKFTTAVPDSPNVPLNIGYVTRSDLTDGTLLVNIHLMEGSNKTDGSILFARSGKIDQDNSNFYWDHINNKLGIGTNNPTANLHVEGSGLFTGNVIISGNLLVSNAQSITTSELTVGGNTIILNDEVTGTPTSNADIIVNRGTSPNVYIRWSETINEWVMYEDAGYAEGHILHSEKTAKTWADYTAMAAYEKSTHPIGAELANNTNEHAKSGYQVANTATSHAISGFIQANSAYISQNTTGSYANSAYAQANTANQRAVTSGSYANSAYDQANTATNNAATADQKAVSAGVYANSAYAQANTATTNAATADQRAVTSGSYANSAYAQANTATTNAATADQRAVTSGVYANAAFDKANTAGSSLSNDTSTNTDYFPTFATATTGTASALLVSSTKLTYNPSTGTLTAVDLNSTSDSKYKENIEPINSAISILNNINGVSFNWKETGNKSYGVIAQELKDILPELVKQGEQGLSVSYIPLIAILIEAVKEQQKQIEELKSRV